MTEAGRASSSRGLAARDRRTASPKGGVRGALRSALGCDLTIAIRRRSGASGAPRADSWSLAPSPLRVFVLLPDAADTSHITASKDGLGARQCEGVTPHTAWIRSPAPFGYAGRTPSSGGDQGSISEVYPAGISPCGGTSKKRAYRRPARASVVSLCPRSRAPRASFTRLIRSRCRAGTEIRFCKPHEATAAPTTAAPHRPNRSGPAWGRPRRRTR